MPRCRPRNHSSSGLSSLRNYYNILFVFSQGPISAFSHICLQYVSLLHDIRATCVLNQVWDLSGGPMAKTLSSNAGGLGLISGWGTGSHMLKQNIPNATTKRAHGLQPRLKILPQGFPWWFSAWESALQCREHQFNPWSRKIPHGIGQLIYGLQLLSLCSGAHKRQLLTPHAAATEADVP